MQQHGLTLITPVIPGREEELRTLLNRIGTDIKDNGIIDFSRLKTVHFLRWVIIPAGTVRGESFPVRLALSTNFDGPAKPHLLELAREAQEGLKQIYAHCPGFPNADNPEEVASYLLRHKVKNAAFYVGAVGRSLRQIEEESRLRLEVQAFLQGSNPSQNWEGKSAKELREEIVKEVGSTNAWAKKGWTPPFLYRFGPVVLATGILAFLAAIVLGFIYIPLITGIVLLALALFIFAWTRQLKAKEAKDRAEFVPAPRNTRQLIELTQREDYKVQNQITHLVDVKAGSFRLGTLKFILGAINLLARTFYNKGNLGGIPSIHFARWALIDNDKRLLFFSNYSGSWESYLGDFIDKAAIGLTGVWANTEGFPPARNLIFSGARQSSDFKAWVRQKQIETQVWYSAYRTLSVQNVNNNTRIRDGFRRNLNEQQSEAWLQHL